MTGGKWGESFLKSGMPLEHLALLALQSIDWTCELHVEYRRLNRDGELKWFEHDVIAYSPESEEGTLQLLMECKYHDESRFWFFLPCETEDHLAQYGALSAGEDLYEDSAVIHCAPYEMLREPKRRALLPLALQCVWGVTVSNDGTRQDNAVEAATKQLAFGFVPFCLESFYGFNRSSAVGALAVIVTSARLFRLRPDIRSLEKVRSARAPDEVAEEVSWLWYYHAPSGDLLSDNMDAIDGYKSGNRFARRKAVADQLLALWSFPHWIAVANIEALATAVQTIYRQFLTLPKDFSGDRLIARIWKERAAERARKRRAHARGCLTRG
jgi:hypothetical protein